MWYIFCILTEQHSIKCLFFICAKKDVKTNISWYSSRSWTLEVIKSVWCTRDIDQIDCDITAAVVSRGREFGEYWSNVCIQEKNIPMSSWLALKNISVFKRKPILVNTCSNYKTGKGLACHLLCIRAENRLNLTKKLSFHNVRTLSK